ncbi:MFS transporter [Serratia nematodiphila]|uniref:MFS transporter n=1 Tax=Serratia nematodiphila TaxID=458197 RepID=UPI001084932A|nr:MFS transporter [Serratia nematodiphila]UTO03456.1 MFS transporter [Serratia nematodiphila]
MNVHSVSTDSDNAHGALLPLKALLALTMSSFIATANETVPAGMLPQIARGMSISEAWAGQMVTLCALGAGAAAIPLTLALGGWPRRRLLLLAIGIFLICNAVTALSPCFGVTLGARFLVGIATGVTWSLLAGYARRLAIVSLQGRAMAIAMLGIPLALALGVPMSAWLGELLDWRWIFAVLASLSALLLVWIRLTLPEFYGRRTPGNAHLREVFCLPGVRPILAVLACWILAHYTLYTYLAPYLAARGLAARVDLALLAFGIAAVAGIALTGLWVDRWLRALVLFSLAAFALVALAFGVDGLPAGAVYVGMVAWGLSFGGAPTLLQTSLADAAGEHADLAQSLLVTFFNLAFAVSGALGGILLANVGANAIPWMVFSLLLVGWSIAWGSAKRGFSAERRAALRGRRRPL